MRLVFAAAVAIQVLYLGCVVSHSVSHCAWQVHGVHMSRSAPKNQLANKPTPASCEKYFCEIYASHC